jgi:cell division protein FtsQ
MAGRVLMSLWAWAMQRRPFGPVGIAGLPIIVGVVLGAAGAAYPPTRDAAISFYDSMRHAVLSRPEFRIRMVAVSGAPRVSDAEIVAALDLAPDERAALGFDARAARRRIESLGWVERASVFVRPPQGLEIRIVQRTPAALWRRGDRLSLLDRGGVLIAELDGPGEWAGLPLFVGPGAQAVLAEGLAIRDEAEAAGLTVAALTRVGGRRWDVDLGGGPRVMLPEIGPFDALREVIAWTARADLLARDFAVVDMRIAFAPTARPRRAQQTRLDIQNTASSGAARPATDG